MEEENLTPPFPVKKAKDVCPGQAILGNKDILFEILHRLPVKLLVRLTLVSEEWFSFRCCLDFCAVCMSSFINKNPSPISPSGFYFYYSCNDGTRSVDSVSLFNTSHPPVPPIKVLGLGLGSSSSLLKVLSSCNGLFLGSHRAGRSRFNVETIIVFNPVTRIAKVLPKWWSVDDEEPSELGSMVSFHLAYDPSISQYYKVIGIKEKSAPFRYEAFIYTSEDDLWRKSSCEFPIVQNMQLFRSGLYLNGRIHWIGEYYSLHFNVNSEEIVRKKMPRKLGGGWKNQTRYYGEWGGRLHFIKIRKLSSKAFTLHELDKDTNEWLPRCRVYLDKIISEFPEVVNHVMDPEKGTIRWFNFNILAVIRGAEESDSEIVVAIPGKVIAYKFYQNTVRLLRNMREKANEELLIDYSCSFPYFETMSHCGIESFRI